MTVTIGIDPGNKGAALLLVDGAPVTRRGYPLAVRWETTAKGAKPPMDRRRLAFASLLEAARSAGVGRPDAVVIERAMITYAGSPERGKAKLIEECGFWVGTVLAWDLPVVRADAGQWLGDLTIEKKPPGKGQTKGWAERAARWWWPGVDFQASSKAKNFHDGLVDAALMALWADLERTWSVQRAGSSKAPWRVLEEPTTCIRARRVFAETCARAKRGAVRLMRGDNEVERHGVKR